MKKRLLMLSLIIFIIIIFLIGCQKAGEKVVLSELQISACNTADKAGSCDTRLEEVGIVTAEDCCRVLGKCC